MKLLKYKQSSGTQLHVEGKISGTQITLNTAASIHSAIW